MRGAEAFSTKRPRGPKPLRLSSWRVGAVDGEVESTCECHLFDGGRRGGSHADVQAARSMHLVIGTALLLVVDICEASAALTNARRLPFTDLRILPS